MAETQQQHNDNWKVHYLRVQEAKRGPQTLKADKTSDGSSPIGTSPRQNKFAAIRARCNLAQLQANHRKVIEALEEKQGICLEYDINECKEDCGIHIRSLQMAAATGAQIRQAGNRCDLEEAILQGQAILGRCLWTHFFEFYEKMPRATLQDLLDESHYLRDFWKIRKRWKFMKLGRKAMMWRAQACLFLKEELENHGIDENEFARLLTMILQLDLDYGQVFLERGYSFDHSRRRTRTVAADSTC